MINHAPIGAGFCPSPVSVTEVIGQLKTLFVSLDVARELPGVRSHVVHAGQVGKLRA